MAVDPDFRRHDAYPFRVAGTGMPGLVELPVTILPTYALTRRCRLAARPLAGATPAGRRAAPRTSGRGRSRSGCGRGRSTPWRTSQALLREAEHRRLPFAVLMFHSSELLAGASPYRPAQADVDVLLSTLDRLFAWSRSRGHTFAGLTLAGAELAGYGRLPVREL